VAFQISSHGFRSWHRTDETIASLRDSFNPDWRISHIVQSETKPADGRVQAVLKINIGAFAPQGGSQCVSRDKFAGRSKQQHQDLKRLSAKFHGHSVFQKLTGDGIGLEWAKAHAHI
jgi:hypothetical protein